MPDFIKYTPVRVDRSTSSTPIFTGPLTAYLNSLLSQLTLPTSEPIENTTSQLRFSWTSGGAKEPEYTTTLQVLTTNQLVPSPHEGRHSSAGAQAAVEFALSKVGSPYVYGASGKNGAYDCSGLISAAYSHAGINVPRTTDGWLSSGKLTVGKYDGKPGDVIITQSSNSPSGRHARIITKNLGNGRYQCVEAKGKNYGVVTSVYTVDNNLKNIYRAKKGLKLTKKSRYEQYK